MGNVVMVRTHVRVAATRIFPVVSPGGEMIVHAAWAEDRMVSAEWRLSEPHVPRQSSFDRFGRQVAGNAGGTNTNGDASDGTEPAAAYDFYGLAKFAKHVGALLAAGLYDALELAGSLDATLRFGNREG